VTKTLICAFPRYQSTNHTQASYARNLIRAVSIVKARTLGLHMQDKTEGEFFLQRLQTSIAGSNSLPPGLPRI